MSRPSGIDGPLELIGAARDLLTLEVDPPRVLAEAAMHATIGDDRTIREIRATPDRARIRALIGAQGGSNLRAAIDDALPGERQAATPLHVLLDDVAGTSLVAGFLAVLWDPRRSVEHRKAMGPLGVRKGKVICSGLRPGGLAQSAPPGVPFVHDVRPAPPISTPDDPWGWHALPDRARISMRRHRRIDVWRKRGVWAIDSFFRDSAWGPDGSEVVVHEYEVEAEIDPETARLRSVHATPRVLPFPECPWAAPHAVEVVGHDVRTFRTQVQQTLTELDCCTHLNDTLRCLSEVPVLARALVETPPTIA